jgi:hypothetical protein
LSPTLSEDRLKKRVRFRSISGLRTTLTLPNRRRSGGPIERRSKVNDQSNRSTRLRYTATGALAALAVVGAIAGTAALAAKPATRPSRHALAAKPATHPSRHALVANCDATKTPAPAVKDKTGAPEPSASAQPFLDDIQRLVASGTITAAEGQTVDREIQAGRVDTDSLTAAGFTQTQLQAVQRALSSTKAGLAAAAHGTSK